MIRHTCTVRVRYRDTDQMGVVYHGVYLEFFETGRTEMLRDLGLPYASIEEQGVMLPVLDLAMTIRRAARYDDLLTIVSEMRERPTARFNIHYTVYRGDEELVVGHTGHVFTTVNGMKPVRPPRFFLEALEVAWEEV